MKYFITEQERHSIVLAFLSFRRVRKTKIINSFAGKITQCFCTQIYLMKAGYIK